MEIPGCTVEPAGKTRYGSGDSYSRTDFIVMDKDKNIIRVCVVDLNEKEGDYERVERKTSENEAGDGGSKNQVRRTRRRIKGPDEPIKRRVRMQGFGFGGEEDSGDGQRTEQAGTPVRKRNRRS